MVWLIILLIMLIILLFPVKVYIRYKNEDRDKIKIEITLIKDLINIPVNIKKNKNIMESKTKKYNYFSKYYNLYKKPAKYFWKNIKSVTIKWITNIGFNDAATTGIISSVLWTLKYTILSFVFKEKLIKNIYIDVIPEFNENKFKTKFVCIIESKVVHIIIVSLWILILNKGGEGFVRTSNRRLNDNNNE